MEVHGDAGALSVTKDRLIVFGDPKSPGGGSPSFWPAHQLDPAIPILLGSVENVAQDVAFVQHVKARTQPESNFAGASRTSQLIDRVVESAQHSGGA